MTLYRLRLLKKLDFFLLLLLLLLRSPGSLSLSLSSPSAPVTCCSSNFPSSPCAAALLSYLHRGEAQTCWSRARATLFSALLKQLCATPHSPPPLPCNPRPLPLPVTHLLHHNSMCGRGPEAKALLYCFSPAFFFKVTFLSPSISDPCTSSQILYHSRVSGLLSFCVHAVSFLTFWFIYIAVLLCLLFFFVLS